MSCELRSHTNCRAVVLTALSVDQTNLDCVLPSTTLAACPGFRVSTSLTNTITATGPLITSSAVHQHGTGRDNGTTTSTSSIVVLTTTNSAGSVITSTSSLVTTRTSGAATTSSTTPSAASTMSSKGRIMGLGLLMAAATSALLSC